jgi:hypothetical protein
MKLFKSLVLLISICCVIKINAQPPSGIHWSADGNSYYESSGDSIIKIQMPSFNKTVIVTPQQLTPKDSSHALAVRNFFSLMMERKFYLYQQQKSMAVRYTRRLLGFKYSR